MINKMQFIRGFVMKKLSDYDKEFCHHRLKLQQKEKSKTLKPYNTLWLIRILNGFLKITRNSVTFTIWSPTLKPAISAGESFVNSITLNVISRILKLQKEASYTRSYLSTTRYSFILGKESKYLVCTFINFHTLCMQTVNGLTRLRGCWSHIGWLPNSYELVNAGIWILKGSIELCLFDSVNRYGHVKTVSSPNHTFAWASLTKQFTSASCTYFCMLLTTTLLESAEGGECP